MCIVQEEMIFPPTFYYSHFTYLFIFLYFFPLIFADYLKEQDINMTYLLLCVGTGLALVMLVIAAIATAVIIRWHMKSKVQKKETTIIV